MQKQLTRMSVGQTIDSLLAVTGREVGNTLDGLPVRHRADTWRRTTTNSLTPLGNFESPIYLRKPSSLIKLHVFGRWEEAGGPEGNPHETRGEHANSS